MRIQDRTGLGPASAEAGRTSEAQRAGRENAGRSGASGSADGDRVELSSTLGRLSQAIAADGAQRADRVHALTANYQEGRFRPNPGVTSRAIVADALSAHGLSAQG